MEIELSFRLADQTRPVAMRPATTTSATTTTMDESTVDTRLKRATGRIRELEARLAAYEGAAAAVPATHETVRVRELEAKLADLERRESSAGLARRERETDARETSAREREASLETRAATLDEREARLAARERVEEAALANAHTPKHCHSQLTTL